MEVSNLSVSRVPGLLTDHPWQVNSGASGRVATKLCLVCFAKTWEILASRVCNAVLKWAQIPARSCHCETAPNCSVRPNMQRCRHDKQPSPRTCPRLARSCGKLSSTRGTAGRRVFQAQKSLGPFEGAPTVWVTGSTRCCPVPDSGPTAAASLRTACRDTAHLCPTAAAPCWERLAAATLCPRHVIPCPVPTGAHQRSRIPTLAIDGGIARGHPEAAQRTQRCPH